MINENLPIEDLKEEFIFPSILNRMQALFFDFGIVLAIVILISMTFLESFSAPLVGLKISLFFVILFIYEPFMSATGGTIGHRTMGMTIRQFEDPKRKLSITQAYFRAAVKLALGWISFLSVSFDPFKRAMHDKYSGSIILFTRY